MDLDQLEAVRRRPGMYIGDTRDGTGLVHMIWELVANSLDEHLSGHCHRIAVELRRDGSVSVQDDGRGMALHLVDGVPFAERAFTTLHTTPTLDGHSPHEHVGLHGVGLFPICALTAWLELQVCQGGTQFWQRFERGRAVSNCEDRGPASSTGTTVTFAPDPEVFSSTWINPGPVLGRLRELSYLLPRLTLAFRDDREHVFHEPRGLQANVDARLPSSSLATFAASGEVGAITVEVAARWGPFPWSSIESFANIERTTDGGSHVDGLLLGLVAGLRLAAPSVCTDRPQKALREALSAGLVAIVCVRLLDPSFGEPTKTRLVTSEAQAAVEGCVTERFCLFLQQESAVLEHLVSVLQTAR